MDTRDSGGEDHDDPVVATENAGKKAYIKPSLSFFGAMSEFTASVSQQIGESGDSLSHGPDLPP